MLEFQEGLKSYNKEFNIFGDDITVYDKDYLLQHIVVGRKGVSKYLGWKMFDKEGIFASEWFDMTLKEIMIKELYSRKLNIDLEMELLQDKMQKIDREIERYES